MYQRVALTIAKTRLPTQRLLLRTVTSGQLRNHGLAEEFYQRGSDKAARRALRACAYSLQKKGSTAALPAA